MSGPSKQERKRLRLEAEQAHAELRRLARENSLEYRDKLYERTFGECQAVFHDLMSVTPHIDVYKFGPTPERRDFFTLVTSGLSNFHPTDGFGRSELVFYFKVFDDQYVSLLHNLAHTVIENDIDVGHGHTISGGGFILANTQFTTVLLLETGVEPESDLFKEWHVDEEPVFMLNVKPITEAECKLIQCNDVVAFLDLLENSPDLDTELYLGPRDSLV